MRINKYGARPHQRGYGEGVERRGKFVLGTRNEAERDPNGPVITHVLGGTPLTKFGFDRLKAAGQA